MTLLRHLNPQEAEHFASGQEEVNEMMRSLGINPAAKPPEAVVSFD